MNPIAIRAPMSKKRPVVSANLADELLVAGEIVLAEVARADGGADVAEIVG